jgi:SNF2 family DNA or RNA helicase
LEEVRQAFPDFFVGEELRKLLEEKKSPSPSPSSSSSPKEEKKDEIEEFINSPANLGGRELFQHQKEGVRFLLRKRFGLLADDMGLGKTLTALAAAKFLAESEGLEIIVIAPKSLGEHWKREASKLSLEISLFSWAKLPAPEEKNVCLIVDEAHYAQSWGSARTKKMIALAKTARAAFLLTGTPMKNGRPANLYPLLVAVRDQLAANKRAYEVRYCDAHPTRFCPWDISGSSNLEELFKKLQGKMLRRKKEDCLNLPEKIRILRIAELSGDAEKTFNSEFSELMDKYEKIASLKRQIIPKILVLVGAQDWDGIKKISAPLPDLCRKIEKIFAEKPQKDWGRLIIGAVPNRHGDGAEALTTMTALRQAASLAKLATARELADELLEQGQQAVVFFEFVASAKQFAEDLRKDGISVELLLGDSKDRQAAVDRFQSGESKVFVGSLKAGGVGITLTAASTVILVDRPWTPGDAIQAEDRVHRIGQKANSTAIWIQIADIDEEIDKLLIEKAENIGLALAGKAESLEMLSPQELSEKILASLLAGGKGEKK